MNPFITSPNPYAPPQAEVRDAEGVADALRLASRRSRLGAWLLDCLMLVALIFAPLIIGHRRRRLAVVLD